MIAFLRGSIIHRKSDAVVLDVNDVGYEVEVSTQTLEQLPGDEEAITLLIHHHVTDSDQRLFGFFRREEKNLFELLITVKGVGPKLGLTILSGMPAARISEAIIQGDTKALSQISGIGKKTAERMVLELKDKIADIVSGSLKKPKTTASNGDLQDQAVAALEALGIRKRDAEQAVSAAAWEDEAGKTTVQDLVKKALSGMNK